MDSEQAPEVILKEPAAADVAEELPEERRTAAVPVVGIGASAGGLEVFKRLLVDLPGDTGFGIVCGVHFSLYREKRIKRRILRRLALRNTSSLAEYAERLGNDAVELSALQRE